MPRPPVGGRPYSKAVMKSSSTWALQPGSCALFFDLFYEASLLVDGIVELREGVAELVRADEIFKPFGKGGVGRLALCEGGIFYGIVVDYCGLN